MAGNIAYITLGEYIYDQPGIITYLTFDIPEESPWEIGIDDDGKQMNLQLNVIVYLFLLLLVSVVVVMHLF